jgi:hypothetical protein
MQGMLRRALMHPRAAALLVAALLVPACGGGTGEATDPGAGTPAAISAAAGDGQQATAATALPVQPSVVVKDGTGRGVPGVTVIFAVTAGDGFVTHHSVTTDASGRAATTWYTGPKPGATNRLRASAAGSLTAEFTATSTTLSTGRVYFGHNEYVEYIVGDIPVIVSAPHGGNIRPASLPDRSGSVTTVRDTNTEELAREIAARFQARVGGTPHTIIMRIHRIKVDANRDSAEATLGNPQAWRAWREFQGYIEAARAAVVAQGKPGFYIDLHGHGHDIQRLELGYMLSASDLAQPDAALNSGAMVQKSSMRAHVNATGQPHAEVIRGARSLGTLFELRGIPAVPSQQQPHPAGAPYFSGGYNTGRHASADGNLITGLQVEANMQGVRDNATSWRRFADTLIDVLREWKPDLLP